MHFEQAFPLFCAWLNCLFVPSAPAAAGAGHEERLLYAGAAHPEQVMAVFNPPPGRAKGRALVCVASGGFFSGPRVLDGMAPFLRGIAAGSGYTVFGVCHTSQGEAVIGDMIPQIQRAVRAIRHGAARFGIDPDHIGIMGFSSGGFMALSAGVRGDDGVTTASDPVERVSSRVQAVVAFFPPTDFLNYGSDNDTAMSLGAMSQFAHALIDRRTGLTVAQEKDVARSISPRYAVTARSAPTLLIHGSADRLVPIQQSRIFLEAMRKAGAPCELRVKAKAGHGWPNMGPDLAAAAVWLAKYLDVKEPAATAKPRARILSPLR